MRIITGFARKAFVFAAALLLAVVGQNARAAVVYNADVTAGSVGSFFGNNPAYLQLITLNGPESEYRIDIFTVFGLRINAVNPASLVVLNFWSGVDPAAGAADALATANLEDQIVFSVPANAAPPGSYNVPLGSAAQPLDIHVPSRTFGFEVLFLNDANPQTYSTTLSMRLSTGTPTVGSNPGFIWTDGNLDGLYAGSEQNRISVAAGPAPTNLRVAIDAVAVPEPGMALAGLGGLLLLARRRR